MPTYVFHSTSFPNRDIGTSGLKFKDGQLVTSDEDAARIVARQPDVVLVQTIADEVPEENPVEDTEVSKDSKPVPAKPRAKKKRKTRVVKPPRKSVTVKRGLKGYEDPNAKAEKEGTSQ